jgi:hypothetical protein
VKVRFVGDPNDNFSGPAQITCWGVEFVKGEWREVESDRFARHSHFEVAREPVSRRGRKPADEAATEGGEA